MKKAILVSILFLGSVSSAEAMEITKVKKKYILIEDREEKIDLEASDLVTFVDNNGAVVGEARILKVKGKKAKGYLIDGLARKGFLVAEKGYEHSIRSRFSPYTRGKSTLKSQVFTEGFNNSPKKNLGIETGAIRSSVGILNFKGHMALSDGMTLGVGFYRYDLSDDSSNLLITGETIALIGTKYFNNRAFSQGAYTRLEVGLISLEAKSDYNSSLALNGIEVSGDASGVHSRANMGYQWQWSNFYTQAYAGIQYMSLKADAVGSDGSIVVTDRSSASETGFDLGFNMGVAF